MPVTRASSASLESPAANTRSHGPARGLVGVVLDSPLRSRGKGCKSDGLEGDNKAKMVASVETKGNEKKEGEEVDEAEEAQSVQGSVSGEGEVLLFQPTEDASSASDSSSEEESDSDESNEEDSETSSSDDEDDDENLQALLAKARLAAHNKASTSIAAAAETADDENIFGELGRLEETKKAEAPLPGLAIPTLPPSLLHLNADGSAGVAREVSRPKVNKGKGRAIPELDTAVHERPLSRRQKEAMPRKQTASDEWAAMPRVAEDVLPQMKRDYQALVLANSLDPKRFMRGGNRAGKVPEKFAIGTIINPPRHLQNSTIEKTREYRPGQIVKDLVGDDGAGEYAKRKYGDLQHSRQRNGRGQGWKSKKPKWK